MLLRTGCAICGPQVSITPSLELALVCVVHTAMCVWFTQPLRHMCVVHTAMWCSSHCLVCGSHSHVCSSHSHVCVVHTAMCAPHTPASRWYVRCHTVVVATAIWFTTVSGSPVTHSLPASCLSGLPPRPSLFIVVSSPTLFEFLICL